MESQAAVLLVEDEAGSDLAPALARCGFAVTPARSPETALFEYGQGDVDAVVAAVPLPGMGTPAMCEQLRRRGGTPILLTSHERPSTEWVAAIDAGADDHVLVPCDDRLLRTRLHALIRRSNGPLTPVRVVRIGHLTVRLRAGVVEEPVEVRLTPVQATLLDHLAAHRGALVGATTLGERIRAVHGDDADEDLIDQLCSLRCVVGKASGVAGAVQEVEGAGWRLLPSSRLDHLQAELLH